MFHQPVQLCTAQQLSLTKGYVPDLNTEEKEQELPKERDPEKGLLADLIRV